MRAARRGTTRWREVLNPDFGAFLNDVAAAAELVPRPDRIGKVRA
jgi:hypothetical protein